MRSEGRGRREVHIRPLGKTRSGLGEHWAVTGKGTYLLLRDVELVPFQHHVAVLPNLPENPFPAEFPDPADLLRRCTRMVSILRPLPPRVG